MDTASGVAHQEPRIRIGLVDDHQIVRNSLRDFLAAHEGLAVVGEAGDGRGAIDLVRQVPMDVLLLDVEMPRQSGMDAIGMIRAKAPEVGILVLSGHPAEQYGVSLMRLGAAGYLNKQCEPEEIVDAVKTIHAGRRYIQPELADLLARNAEKRRGRAPHESLTNRELQIFLKLARGRKPEEIAGELSLSPKTVSSYRCKLMEKLQLGSNSDITYYAIKHGLLD